MMVIMEAPPAVGRLRQGEVESPLRITAGGKRQRIDDPVAETRIREIGPVEMDEKDKLIAGRGLAIGVAHHRAGVLAHVKSDRVQCPGHQPVHFVAPAAAAFAYDLLEDRRRIAPDRSSELHIEILIGDGIIVQPMNGAQSFHIGLGSALIADAAEIVLELETISHTAKLPAAAGAVSIAHAVGSSWEEAGSIE